jgi:hypothetical protein
VTNLNEKAECGKGAYEVFLLWRWEMAGTREREIGPILPKLQEYDWEEHSIRKVLHGILRCGGEHRISSAKVSAVKYARPSKCHNCGERHHLLQKRPCPAFGRVRNQVQQVKESKGEQYRESVVDETTHLATLTIQFPTGDPTSYIW